MSKIDNFAIQFKKWGIALVLLGMIIIFSITTPKFFSVMNISNLVGQNVVYGIMACGVLFPIISGGFDLSIGSTAALAGIITADILVRTESIFLSILAGLSVGIIVGLCNGLLITKLKINAFVITLGTMTSVRGLIFIYTHAEPIYGFPAKYNVIGMGTWGFIPIPMLIWFVVAALCYFVFKYTKFGTYVYAVGGNENSANLSGVKVDFIKICCFTISGFFASTAGIILLFRIMTGIAQAAGGYELIAMAACFIGGCKLGGGKGGVLEAVVGTFILGIILNELNLLGVSAYWHSTVLGIIIIVAVALYTEKKAI